MTPSDAEYVAYVQGRIPALRRLAYHLCGDAHHADDLVQETIAKLYAAWGRVSAADGLDRYTRTTLVRTFLDVYRDGTLTALKGERAAAVAVDGAGVIVGRVGQRPARWASPAGDPVLLPLPPGATTGSAVAVAADGTIAGHVSDKDGLVLTAYLWRPDGSHGPVDLPVVDGKRALWFEPQSVRGGWVYGALVVQGDRVTARTGPSGEPVPIEPAIHAFRQIPFRIEVTTGRSQALPQPADRSLGALYVGDRVVTLPPDPTAAEGSDYHVSAVGDDGRTAAGESSASSGPPIRPVAWRCD
jgi:hypothetical protein